MLSRDTYLFLHAIEAINHYTYEQVQHEQGAHDGEKCEETNGDEVIPFLYRLFVNL